MRQRQKFKNQKMLYPECKEPYKIAIDEYHIKLYECANGHSVNGIKIDEFNKTQEINVSEIKYDKCKIKNKGNSVEFFYCSTCKDNFCLICKSNHNFNHNQIRSKKLHLSKAQ